MARSWIAGIGVVLAVGCGRIGFGLPAPDADHDAAPLDAAPSDALPLDAAPFDAPPEDAGEPLDVVSVTILGSTEDVNPNDADVDASGAVYLAGAFSGTLTVGDQVLTSAGSIDMFAVSLDAAGGARWAVSFGNASSDHFNHLVLTPSGNSYLTGLFEGDLTVGAAGRLTNAGGDDALIVALSDDGTVRWARALGSSLDQRDAGGVVFAGGVVYAASEFQGTLDTPVGSFAAAGGTDGYVARIDDDGVVVGVTHFDDPVDLHVFDAEASPLGDVIVVGSFDGPVDLGGGLLPHRGGTDIYVLSMAPFGTHRWSTAFGDSGSPGDAEVHAADDGRVFVMGSFEGDLTIGDDALVSAGGTDALIVQLASDGSPVWARRFGGAEDDIVEGVVTDEADRVFAAGAFRGTVDFGGGPLTSAGGEDIFVVVLTREGSHVFSRRFGGPGNDRPDAIALSPAGELVVVGQFEGTADFGGEERTALGTSDAFVLRLRAP